MRFFGFDGAGVPMLFGRIAFEVEDFRAVVRHDGEGALLVAYLGREKPEADAHGRHAVVMVGQLPVIGVPPLAVAAPSYAGERADARKTHVVQIVGLFRLVRNVGFAEERPLQADDVAHLFIAEALFRKVESEDLFGVEDRRPVVPLLLRRLPHVEIEVFARHHHGLVAFRRGVETRLDALPAVYETFAREAARGHGFVPYAGTLAVGRENRRHALHEEVFQSVRIGHAPPAHQRLTVGAAVPLGHVHLVAADVYVLRGKQRA